MPAGPGGPIVVTAIGDFIFFARPKAADIAAVHPFLDDAEIVVGNIDVVLSDRGTPVPKWAALRAPPAIAGDLRELGLDVAVLANNHTMDFRAEAMRECLAAYRAAGIRPSGAGESLAEATAATVIETPGGCVALLSVCSTLSPESAAGPGSPGVAPLKVWQAYKLDDALLTEQPGTPPEVMTWPDAADLARVKSDIRSARQLADRVLVFIHWGVPSYWRPPAHPVLQDSQRVIGHALIEAGADAVIGNHAHELHGIEFYQSKPIVYCLGNFWIEGLQRYPWMGREGVVMRILLHPDQSVGLDLLPCFLDDRGVPRSDDTARAITVLTARSREFDVTFAPAGDRYVVVPAGENTPVPGVFTPPDVR